ncbi:MAG: hypothetical protein FH757_00890 [Alcanivorax sp.]|nr:hypothetical protein [Alcanivorax sp.]
MSSHKPWADSLPLDRLIWTLDLVHREGAHLLYSWRSIFEGESQPDATWVAALDERPEEAVRLEAFVSRFGRMQDTMADKLIPRWLDTLAESPGSQIENLNRAERLGVISSTENWLIARKLRNRLVHEYMRDASDFAAALEQAKAATLMLIDTYNRLRDDLPRRLSIDDSRLPAGLS